MSDKEEVVNPYQAPDLGAMVQAQEFADVGIFKTSGRIGRIRYMAYPMGLYFLLLIPMMILGATADSGIGALEVAGFILFFIALIAFMIFVVCYGVRRLNDMNYSGWFLLLAFVPVVNMIFTIALLLLPGTDGQNDYGPPPPVNGPGAILTAFILPVAMLGVLAGVAIPSYNEYTERARAALEESQSE